MAEDRPNELPQWAESGSAEVSTPTTAKRNQGWFEDESPAHDWENFMKRMYGKWLKHLGYTVSTFDSLLDACGDTGEFPIGVGDTCFIDESYDPAHRISEPIAGYDPTTYGTSAKDVRGICTDGKYVYIVSASATNGDAAVINRILREDGSVDGTWSVTTSAVMTDSGNVVWELWTDGVILVFASSAAVEVYDVVAGGASSWSKSYTSHDIRRCCADETHVYVTDNQDVIAYLRNGTLSWTFDHGAEVTGIATDNRYLYLFGAASGHASGASLRRLDASNGDSATTEGGTAAGGSDVWDATVTVGGSEGSLLLGGNSELFIHYTDGSAQDVLSRRNQNNGSAVWTKTYTSGGLGRPFLDADYIWTSRSSVSEYYAVDYNGDLTGRVPAVFPTAAAPGGVNGGATMQIGCSDGSFIWAGGNIFNVSLAQIGTLAKWSRGSKIRHWKRLNVATKFTMPLWQHIVPA